MKSVAKPGCGSVAASIARRRPSARAQRPSDVCDTRMPISHSFDTTISRCSRRVPTSSISPPAMPHAISSVPASTRSAMISLSADRSSSTPSIWIVELPAPTTCAPMRSRNAARSVTSGSRAAFSITVVPLASTAAHMRFSVAPTLGNSSSMREPWSMSARACTKPCSTDTSAPIDSRPRRCMSTLRLPMLSPPGSATRASPQRASSGPSTLNDARMRVTSS